MELTPSDGFLALIALAVIALVLRYARVIIKTLMVLSGLFFLAITTVVVTITMGWWEPAVQTAVTVFQAVAR
jgi:hypothetical protein